MAPRAQVRGRMSAGRSAAQHLRVLHICYTRLTRFQVRGKCLELQVNSGINPMFWLFVPLMLALSPRLVLVGWLLGYIFLPRAAKTEPGRRETRFTARLSAEDLWGCSLVALVAFPESSGLWLGCVSCLLSASAKKRQKFKP